MKQALYFQVVRNIMYATNFLTSILWSKNLALLASFKAIYCLFDAGLTF